MTVWTPPPGPWYLTFAIHGPALERARPGGYWGLDDELNWCARTGAKGAKGVVLIDCIDQEEADRRRLVIDGLGLVAGHDYAVLCASGEHVETPLVKWRHTNSAMDFRMQPVAAIDWAPGPKPPEVDDLFRRLHDYLWDVRWPTLRDVARRWGTATPEMIEEASKQPTDYERWKHLNDAMQAGYRRAEERIAGSHRPVLLSHTFGHWSPVEPLNNKGPST